MQTEYTIWAFNLIQASYESRRKQVPVGGHSIVRLDFITGVQTTDVNTFNEHSIAIITFKYKIDALFPRSFDRCFLFLVHEFQDRP